MITLANRDSAGRSARATVDFVWLVWSGLVWFLFSLFGYIYFLFYFVVFVLFYLFYFLEADVFNYINIKLNLQYPANLPYGL